MCGFTLWSSTFTARVTERAIAASELSTDYVRASRAVAAEESLECKYRLEPGKDVLARYNQAADDLVAAVMQIRLDGGEADVAAADGVLAAHVP